MSDKDKKINPQVKTTTIGVKVLKEINVYPLAIGDQLKLTDQITKIVVDYFAGTDALVSGTDTQNVKFVSMIMDLIKDNVRKIIKLVSEEDPDVVMSDMTNEQLYEFVNLVYEENFGGVRKKVIGLIQKITGQEEIEEVKENDKIT